MCDGGKMLVRRAYLGVDELALLESNQTVLGEVKVKELQN